MALRFHMLLELGQGLSMIRLPEQAHIGRFQQIESKKKKKQMKIYPTFDLISLILLVTKISFPNVCNLGYFIQIDGIYKYYFSLMF
jgi:hypothetical protein